jgi:hypothetical protein
MRGSPQTSAVSAGGTPIMGMARMGQDADQRELTRVRTNTDVAVKHDARCTHAQFAVGAIERRALARSALQLKRFARVPTPPADMERPPIQSDLPPGVPGRAPTTSTRSSCCGASRQVTARSAPFGVIVEEQTLACAPGDRASKSVAPVLTARGEI